EDEVQLACAKDHRLAKRNFVRWADLRGELLIVFRPDYGVRQLIESTLREAGIEPVVTHEVGFLSTAAWMAASGLGVTFLPKALAQLEARHALAVRPLVKPTVVRMIALVTKKGRSLSPSCRLF